MTRRSKMEILIVMKEYLDTYHFIDLNKTFYKSDFRSKGIDPSTAEEFLNIVSYCQTQFPPIDVIKTDKNFLIKLSKNKIFYRTPIQQELLENTQNREKGDFSKFDSQLLYQSPPIVIAKFRCVDCEIESDYPEHCNEPMDYKTNENLLTCEICGLSQPVPIHHGKTMKIIVERKEKE